MIAKLTIEPSHSMNHKFRSDHKLFNVCSAKPVLVAILLFKKNYCKLIEPHLQYLKFQRLNLHAIVSTAPCLLSICPLFKPVRDPKKVENLRKALSEQLISITFRYPYLLSKNSSYIFQTSSNQSSDTRYRYLQFLPRTFCALL